MIKRNLMLIGIFVISFFIFYPSLFTFYTNDDFFFLKISQAANFREFINFFNIFSGPDGFGVYRPLTTQFFYFLSHKLFNHNPLPLHLISFVVFFLVAFLIYKLSIQTSQHLNIKKSRQTTLLAMFLYAISATHFAHLYYLATFQELGMTLFVILSCINFIEFIKSKKIKYYLFSLFSFVLSLMSKETAVVTPFLIYLIFLFDRSKDISTKEFFVKISPYIITLFVYLFIRVVSYGFATGDSYIWSFSPVKLLNTMFWYLLWSLNLPETLIDFVGPGFTINPNLWTYWGHKFIPIFVLFAAEVLILMVVLVKNIKKINLNVLKFGIVWFVIGLVPVVFLPQHKFPFYLTLPLFGFVLIVAELLIKSKKVTLCLFTATFLFLSILTLNHTRETHWVTQGSEISFRVLDYLRKNNLSGSYSFVDKKEDRALPFSPTETVKVALSDKNFFWVYFPEDVLNVSFGEELGQKIESRQFLGY